MSENISKDDKDRFSGNLIKNRLGLCASVMKGIVMLRVSKLLLLSSFLFLSVSESTRAQGILLRGIGAVSDSMVGTAIATPLDAGGTIYANPAAIAGLESQIGFDLGVIMPHSTVTSELAGGAGRGTANSQAGQIPAPTMSFVNRNCPHSRLTYGIAIAGVGGAAALYPGMGDVNPILHGEARASNVQIFQIMPTASYKVTNRLALGFSPVIGLASLSINPMPFGLDAAYPMQNYGTRYTWGGGFNIGAYYDFKNHWKAGFTFKSPVWSDPLRFTGTQDGLPTDAELAIDLPLILGWGVSYSGFRNTIIGVDIRYMDYANTKGFRDIMDDNGTVIGLGWDSVTAVSVGVERKIGDRLRVRAGYCYNTNPISSESQYANVASPLFMQHVLGLGCTVALPKSIDAHLAWTHAFHNEKTGYDPSGRVKVINTSRADTILAGITKRF